MVVHFDPSAFVADPELIDELEKIATPVDGDMGCVLFSQGDSAVGLYLLRTGGAVLTMKAADDNTIFTVETGPGSLLGLPAVIGNQPYSLTAVAHQGAQVRFISRDAFTAMMEGHPELSLKILQVLAAEVRTARRALY